ncbi:class I SAM-dependent methyltransferase [Nostoc sp.]|uniref:class I SAM-dependent methyltransferase n=1 Tax=Nostoc sp. TaxID=1180 RepID=UPI002FFC00AF
MKGINSYWQQWTNEEIATGKHRDMVGGLWDEMGCLQFEFLKQQGLLPEHSLLDVGCGSLRGGVHFVRYLDAGQYCGLDINASLIEAGKAELAAQGLLDKRPQLLVNEGFEFSRFEVQFDFALAVSVFTHLFMNHISRCLLEVKKVLKPNGKFYASFFQASHTVCLSPLVHQPGNITTFYDSDPFHYSPDELKMLAENAGLCVELIGDWEHPRSQKMVCIRHIAAV